ncbi:MAG: PAC2 family protein [Planctomycetota bacterium]
MRQALVDPYLVSIWPGMGKVALSAGSHLVETLGAERILDIPIDDFFEIEKVEVQDGIACRGWLPKCTLYGWKNPGSGRDLLISIAEAQPNRQGYELCRHVLSLCRQYGVSRVYTFAAMASQIHPTGTPRVVGVTNEATLFDDLNEQGVEILQAGQISGLNGVLLAAASELGMGASCLLGEIPFYAVSVPNPKASMAVLEIFSRIAGFDIALGALRRQARSLETRLVELLDRMNIDTPDAETVDLFDENAVEELTLGDFMMDPPIEEPVTDEDSNRIESLFRAAEEDRRKAVELKDELDRLGAFRDYEDRFLDLFRRR